MEYILDISEGYTHLLAFSSEFGFDCYMSTPNLSFSKGDKIEIFFENIEVNILDERWYLPIINQNPKSILVKYLSDLDLNESESTLTVSLKRAKIIINNVNSLFFQLSNKNNLFHHTLSYSFKKFDRKIWLTGLSTDFEAADVTFEAVYQGKVYLIFNESDITIKSIGFKELFSCEDVLAVNRSQEVQVKLKKRSFHELNINNIRSNFIDFDYKEKYFKYDDEYVEAIVDYLI